ncbi:MAG: 16S rRNA (uracil(1498)-N(3))-methyltransferase [Deltaproteobacteria bacterium]|nr:16S rRNA (uracil(1498)-N(3))-methyltransferase [Deltaproteobacteria bacterium]
MNLLLLRPDELDGSVAELDERRSAHVRDVLGAEPGARLRAGVERGPTGEAEVLSVHGAVQVRFEATGSAPVEPRVDLVLALPRPKVLSRIIEHAASFAVGRIDLINAWRVDKSYFDSPRAGSEALAAGARLGCEQGRHTWVPELTVHQRFMTWIETLPASAERVRLVAHPGTGATVADCNYGARRVVVAIGPEGGWIDRELATFERLSFDRVVLSSRVLRSEVAVSAALAQLEMTLGQ